jgi:hypothetical protein
VLNPQTDKLETATTAARSLLTVDGIRFMSSVASDAGYPVLIPWPRPPSSEPVGIRSQGLRRLSLRAAFTVNILVTPTDGIVTELTNDAIHFVDRNTSIDFTANVWLSIASVALLTLAIALVTEGMVEPGLCNYRHEEAAHEVAGSRRASFIAMTPVNGSATMISATASMRGLSITNIGDRFEFTTLGWGGRTGETLRASTERGGVAMANASLDDRHQSGTYRRIELITGDGRRRVVTEEEKARILTESFQPGAKVSDVARRHGMNRGLLWTWASPGAETWGGRRWSGPCEQLLSVGAIRYSPARRAERKRGLFWRR